MECFTMKNGKFQAAVIGMGEGFRHIEAYKANPEFELVAICDVNMEYCEKRKVEYQLDGIKMYSDYRQVVADPDIDINMLRIFRKWLATELLSFNTGIDGGYIGKYTDNQVHMLEYYKNNMYNDVVKQLTIFGSSELQINSNALNTACGCCNNNKSTLYNLADTAVCDALTIYRKNIHNLMVATFEDVEFWRQFNPDFIKVFKKFTGMTPSKYRENFW